MTGRTRIPLLLAVLLAPAHVMAGPVPDAETRLREAYADYRVALFQSSAGKADATAGALGTLDGKWEALAKDWTASPPPQYADDPKLAETLTRVDQMIEAAKGEAAKGDLAKVHEGLEAIRGEIGDLHGRNGIIGFSDRMNAYHAEMEKVLDAAAEGAADPASMRDAAAVLVYLAQDVAAHPAPEAADPAYAPLVDAMTASAQALHDAVLAADATAMKVAVAALKPAYAKLFLKFG